MRRLLNEHNAEEYNGSYNSWVTLNDNNMSIGRISNINIAERPMFTAIYGRHITGEADRFITKDLKIINIREALYLTLKSEGFDMVVFYDNSKNFFSYSEKDIERFLNKEIEEKSKNADNKPKRFTAKHMKAPLGSFRKKVDNDKTATYQQEGNSTIRHTNNYSTLKSEHARYYTNSGQHDGVEYLNRIMPTQEKSAFIFFADYRNKLFDDNKDSFINMFNELSLNSAQYNSKVIVVYQCDDLNILFERWNTQESKKLFFYDTFFKNLFVPNKAIHNDRKDSLFKIGSPCLDEIERSLHRKRLFDKNLKPFCDIKFEKIVKQLSYDFDSINKILSTSDIPLSIQNASKDKSGEQKLNELIGLKEVKETIAGFSAINFVDDIINETIGETKKDNKMLNFVFSGNPGTGKTTVARILGDILCELELLDKPTVIECRKEDLVGEYVGQTAPKVKAKFDEAIGKVLFIDEAYSLAEDKNFGKEAIDTIVGCLTDPTYMGKMAVVIAGYPDDMDNLLKINPGLGRRFNHQINFSDYTNDELVTIFEKIVESKKISVDSDYKELAMDWFSKHPRTKDFANAGLCGSLYDIVKTNMSKRLVKENQESDTSDVNVSIKGVDFPNYDKFNNKDNRLGLDQLNDLIGLETVKNEIKGIENLLKSEIKRSKITKKSGSALKLNFVFQGNPGTGKTTVARMLGIILNDIGALPTNSCVECVKSDLVGQHVGTTAPKVRAKFDEAIGQVLFIDEAYSLAEDEHFGKEAIDTIVDCLTNPKYMGKMAVVIAGYPKDIDRLLDKNVGLRSRFNSYVNFPDYSNDELFTILEKKINSLGMRMQDNCKQWAVKWFSKFPRIESFANGRLSENLLNETLKIQAKRTLNIDDHEIIMTIIDEDIPSFIPINQRDERKAVDKLNSMIGLNTMKETIVNIMTDIRFSHMRRENSNVSLNFVFMGNPGTGKTTVARFVGEMLSEIGIIPSSEVVEVSRSNLIAQYVGQTAPLVDKVFDSAIGKVLFIDEVYSLINGKDDQFGKEAVDTIVANLTKKKYLGKMAVVIAGYPDETRKFINVNPGMERRFSHYINFDDYTNDELCKIFFKDFESSEYNLDEGLDSVVLEYFESIHRGDNFGNAAVAKGFAKKVISNLNKRLIDEGVTKDDKDKLWRITAKEIHG